MKLVAWCTALLLLVAVAVGLDGAGGDRAGDGRSGTLDVAGAELVAASRLRAFESCDELLAYLRDETAAAGPAAVGVGGGAEVAGEPEGAIQGVAGGGQGQPRAGAPTTAAADTASARAAAGDDAFSGTNLQERDVDEPDTVKTDGDVLVAVAGSELHVVDPGGGVPVLLATVPLPPDGTSEVLLAGDRVTVLTRTWARSAGTGGRVGLGMGMGLPGAAATVLTSVDITEPTAPRVLESRTLEGDYVSARMTGSLARVVLRSSPRLGHPEPQVLERGDVETWVEDAAAAAPLEAWLPDGEDGPLVACEAVSRPAEPSGTSTVTVLTIDVGASLDPVDATAVVADAHTVYASTDRLYVATTSWSCCAPPVPVEPGGGMGDTSSPRAPEPVTTDLHAFDTTGRTTPYLGSGRVEGRLLNSFSLSEHDGVLRVATTVDATSGEVPSESAVVTLGEQDGGLVARGRLAGLGTTEQIYAVRYLRDVAYVVTFRQTDPLYAIDLSDPAAPRLVGELKVSGYSSYLHPLDDGRLLGVGQDATDEGRTLGSQVSTFDVADLAAPVQEDRLSFPDSTSAVEHDHRAFLWWAQDRVAVVPLESHAFDVRTGAPAGQPFIGAVAVDVAADGTIVERGRVTHQGAAAPGTYPAITRAVVVGDTLFTVSEVGVLASDLATLAPKGWLGL